MGGFLGVSWLDLLINLGQVWVLYWASSGLYPRQNQLQTSRKQWNGQKLLIRVISFDCPSSFPSRPLSQLEKVLCPLQFYWVWGEYLSRKLQLLLWRSNVSVIVWIFEYSFKKVLAHFTFMSLYFGESLIKVGDDGAGPKVSNLSSEQFSFGPKYWH